VTVVGVAVPIRHPATSTNVTFASRLLADGRRVLNITTFPALKVPSKKKSSSALVPSGPITVPHTVATK
jgi:hypothetical protein